MELILLAGFILMGVDTSHNLGEERKAVLLQTIYSSNPFNARIFLNTSNKVESGGGYILGTDLDLHKNHVIFGIGHRYRDGGNWIKHTGWLRSGLSFYPITLVGAIDLTSDNHVKVLEVCSRWLAKRLAMETRVGFVRYDQSKSGMYTSLSLGWTV